jgi:hypothetical protein
MKHIMNCMALKDNFGTFQFSVINTNMASKKTCTMGTKAPFNYGLKLLYDDSSLKYMQLLLEYFYENLKYNEHS